MIAQVILFVGLLPPLMQANEPARIKDLLDALGSPDRTIREAAAAELRNIGDPVLKPLEERMRSAGVGAELDLYKDLLKRKDGLREKGAEAANPQPSLNAGPAAPDIHRLPKPPANQQREAYVHEKLTEAVILSDGGKFVEAESVVSRLLELESASMYRDYLREVKNLCDREISRAGEFQTAIIPDRPVYEVGEAITLTLRIDNVGTSDLIVRFPFKRTSILGIVVTAVDPIGSTTALERPDMFEFDQEIRINVGSYWEKTYRHETSSDGINPGLFRVLSFRPTPVSARVVKGSEECDRQVVFDPMTIKILPKGQRDRVKEPLAAMTKAIDSGTVNDVFFAAVMLDGDQKKTGIDLLVTTLKNARGPGAQTVMRALGVLTDKDFGLDARKWITWWEGGGK